MSNVNISHFKLTILFIFFTFFLIISTIFFTQPVQSLPESSYARVPLLTELRDPIPPPHNNSMNIPPNEG